MDIYEPAEDTLLLLDNIHCGRRVLEIGAGSGIISIHCAKQGSEVVTVDIDEDSVNYVMRAAKREHVDIKVIRSDLFENVDGKFDTIIFNPPYLPGEPEDLKDRQWAGGGEHGDLTILRFLEQADEYLEDNGEIYIVLSSFNRLELLNRYPFKFKQIAKMKLSFHEIYVYLLKKA